MRQSFNQKIIEINGKKVGVFTGSDFCAEHEWGIAGLRKTLGMIDSEMGVERRRVRDTTSVSLVATYIPVGPQKGEYYTYLLMSRLRSNFYNKENELMGADELWNKKCKHLDGDLYCEWDENGLLILAKGKENFELLNNLSSSACNGDLFVGHCGGVLFSNGGLTVVGINDIPDESKKEMLDADLDKIKLKKASEATGIEYRLRATHSKSNSWNGYKVDGCRWFALSPRWLTEGERAAHATKHPVIYWLNPEDQKNCHADWFTVEDLEQWARGEGKIIKK